MVFPTSWFPSAYTVHRLCLPDATGCLVDTIVGVNETALPTHVYVVVATDQD